MGKVELTIHSTIKDALDGISKLHTNTAELNAETKKYEEKTKAAFYSTAQSAGLLNVSIDKLESNLKTLTTEWVNLAAIGSKMTKEQKQRWQELNGEIEKTKGQISELKSKQTDLGYATSKTTGLFSKLAGTIATAFSVYTIVNFTKVSVAAYQEQLRAEAKLSTTLKGREGIVKSLIKQANQLQKITLFDDEQIINAQALLGLFVKEEDQLKQLTPLVLDLAQAKNIDLASAADAVGKATIGVTRGLKAVGINLKYTGDQATMTTAVIDELTRALQGQAESALTPEERGLRRVAVAMNELRESWGKLSLSAANAGILKESSDVVTRLGIAVEQIGKTRGFERISEIIGLLTFGPSLNPDYYDQLAKDWELTAKYAGIWADIINSTTDKLVQSQVNSPYIFNGPWAAEVIRVNELISKSNGELITEAEELTNKIRLLDDEADADQKKQLEDRLKRIQSEIDYRRKLFDEKNAQAKEEQAIQQTNLEYQTNITQKIEDEEQAAKDAAAEELKLLEAQQQRVESLTKALDKLTEAWQDEPNVDDIPFDTAAIKKEYDDLIKFTEDNPLWASLGFTDEEQLDAARDMVDEISNLITDIVDQQVEASERLVSDLNQRIDEQGQLVEREFEMKQEGLANNYEVEQQNLKQMQQARDQAIKDREKNIQIQRTLSTVESGISLIVAAANIMKGFSEIPIVGVILGIAAVGAMLASFLVAKDQATQATQFEEGGQAKHGLLKGRRHSDGGIPVVAEEGEWFINRQSSKKYSPLLDAINMDDQEKMKLFFDRQFINKMPQSKIIMKDIDDSKRLGEIVRELKKGKAEVIYGNGFIVEKIGGYTKRINLN
jgi:hypothetical protein